MKYQITGKLGINSEELELTDRLTYVFSVQITELMPLLHQLSRVDKYRVLQLLTSKLADEEGTNLHPGAGYPIWSPYDSWDAAATLSHYLRENADS